MKIRIKTHNGELPSYLTMGKIYTLDHTDDFDGGLIFDDNNERRYILLNDCAYLNGGSWEVVDE